MPIYQLMQAAAFDAAAVQIITTAFDNALKELGLELTDPKAEVVARKVIGCARMGERDPARLRELATVGLR